MTDADAALFEPGEHAMAEEYLAGATLRELGSKYGIHQTTVMRALHKAGCELRPLGRRPGLGSRTKVSERERASAIRCLYGIELVDYERLANAQGGVCAICGVEIPLVWGAGGSVDHDHDTGDVRGILCSNCNAGLGMFGDDPEIIRSAAMYLERANPTGSATWSAEKRDLFSVS